MFFHKGAKGARFDIEKYNKLKEEVIEVSSFTHKLHMHSFHGFHLVVIEGIAGGCQKIILFPFYSDMFIIHNVLNFYFSTYCFCHQ